METKIEKARRSLDINIRDIKNTYDEMISAHKSYWALSSSFVEILLYGHYFNESSRIAGLIELGFEYFNTYIIEEDPWYAKDRTFDWIYYWNKYIYYRLTNTSYAEEQNIYYDHISNMFRSKKIFKSDAADWENYVFISWFTSHPLSNVSEISEICKRKLIDIYLSDTDTIGKADSFRKQFNRNRNNLLVNVEKGIPQIYYFYSLLDKEPTLYEISKAQLEGL